MSQQLEHATHPRAYPQSHRAPYDIDIDHTPITIRVTKTPLRILWKHRGSGLGTTCYPDCLCAVLFPYVEYDTGARKPRLMPAEEWVKAVGRGKAVRRDTDEHRAMREACSEKSSRMAGKMLSIMRSIHANGGTIKIS